MQSIDGGIHYPIMELSPEASARSLDANRADEVIK
jgi:hypothetical protein